MTDTYQNILAAVIAAQLAKVAAYAIGDNVEGDLQAAIELSQTFEAYYHLFPQERPNL